MCERVVCEGVVCERVGGAGGGADASAQPKTRTPHKDVGEKLCRGNWQGYAKMLYNFLLRNTFVLI